MKALTSYLADETAVYLAIKEFNRHWNLADLTREERGCAARLAAFPGVWTWNEFIKRHERFVKTEDGCDWQVTDAAEPFGYYIYRDVRVQRKSKPRTLKVTP